MLESTLRNQPDSQSKPLRAEVLVARLNELIQQHGNLPVTFGDQGKHVRDVQFLVLPADRDSESTVEIIILGW